MRIAAVQTIVAGRAESQNAPEGVSFYPILGYFRETNAECLRIRDRLVQAIDLAESDAKASTAAAAFQEASQVIRREIAESKRRAEGIEKLRSGDVENHAWYAREFVQIANGWDDLDQLWPAAGGAEDSPAKFLSRGKESVKVLDAVIFRCACQTIPNELDNYLKNYRIGKCLDFVATFKDQLPDEASTRAVLAVLAPQSGIVSGLIDLENAKVIKADQRWWRQALSVAVVLFAAGLGFGLIAAAVNMTSVFQFDAAGWRLGRDQWSVLNGVYLLVLLGVLGHWILDRVKQNRAGTDVTPLAEWLMWIHINEVAISMRIATVWLIVALGVAFRTFDLSQGVQPMTCFTAGYFLDSTFDALIGRFNTFIGKAQKAAV